MRKILIVIMILLINNLKSQNNINNSVPNIFSVSPSVNTLSTFGNYGVNLSTGNPEININLFKIFDYNVNLSYDVQNVKPDSPVSFVGLGWTLNMTSTITRIPNGEIDELRDDSYYYNYSTLNSSDWYSDDKLKYYGRSNFDLGRIGSPDEFSFNIYGLSGSFYKNHEGKWVVKSSNDISLKILDEMKNNYLGMNHLIYSFTIIDSKGNKYFFGGAPEMVDIFSIKRAFTTDDITDNYIKTWYLKKIELSNGKVINFTYQKLNEDIYIKHSITDYKEINGFYGCEKNVSSNDCINNLVFFEKGSITFLSSITYDNTHVDLYKSLANSLEYKNEGVALGKYKITPPIEYYTKKHWFKIDSIVINNNNEIKRISFNYHENNNQRLKIKSLCINNLKYNFEYNASTLPDFNSRKIDHWGYFNNRKFNLNINLQDNNIVSQEYYTSREPNENYSEILEKIIFPTKGYSKFIYEPHRYSKLVKRNENGYYVENVEEKITGGLRIKEIQNFDQNNYLLNKKKYSYTHDNSKSSGVLSGMPIYDQYLQSFTTYWQLSSNSYSPLNFTRGSHILYSRVSEENMNGSKTIYEFSNFDNGQNDRLAKNFINSYGYQIGVKDQFGTIRYAGFGWVTNKSYSFNVDRNSLEQERGYLLKKIDMSSINDTIRKNIYKYRNDESRFNNPIRMLKTSLSITVLDFPLHNYQQNYANAFASHITALELPSYKTYLKENIEIQYFKGEKIINTTSYEYSDPFHNQLTTTIVQQPDVIFKKDFLYAKEKNNQKLIDAYMIGVPLQTTTNKTANGITKTISDVETIYPDQNNYPTTQAGNLLLPLSVKSYELNSEGENTLVTFDLYDDKGNIKQYTSKTGVPTAIIWGYNQTRPIAKIEGATYAQVEQYILDIVLKSNTDTDQASENTLIGALDTFRNNVNLKSYQITTYTYNPLTGVTSITPTSGIREIYKYDTDNRLEKVVDVNDNILKEYKYNYAKQKYYNNEQSKEFIKNNCESNYIGGKYTYVVPSDKYFSYISTEDANQKAINDLNTNGQNQANIYGSCTKLDCIFKINYPLINGSGGLYLYDSTRFVVSMGYSFNSSLDWTNGVLIGKIQGNCLSPNERISSSYSNGLWGATIKPNGDVIVKFMPGPSFTWPANGTNISLQLFYSL